MIWENLPSTNTPITAENLNKIGKTINVSETDADLNDYVEDGVYFFEQNYTPVNIPTGVVNGWLQVMVGEGQNGTRVKQIWYRAGTVNSNDYETYVRTRNGDEEWSNWQRFVMTKQTDEKVGDLSELETTNKENLVNAINEVNSTRLTKLWKNPNPTSRFAAQTITLASDDYDYLIWFFKGYSAWTRIQTDMTLKGYGITLVYAGSAQMSNGRDWRIGNFNRPIDRTNDTSYSAGLAALSIPNGDTYAGNGISDGEWCIPIAVYGGKF